MRARLGGLRALGVGIWRRFFPSPDRSPTRVLRPPAVLPRLGSPGPGGVWVPILLAVTAGFVLWPASITPWELYAGGTPDLPGNVAHHWMIQTRGLAAATHNRMQMYPCSIDFVVLLGFPLDVYTAWPFVAVFGRSAGFTLWQVASLWAAGCAMAWLAARWWRSHSAGLVAGVAYQCAPVITWGMDEGRFMEVVGAAFIPLSLGLFARSLVSGRRWEAVVGGACLGFAALSYWFFGFFVVLALGVLLLLAKVERRPVLRPASLALVGILLVAGLPLAYTLLGASILPAIDLSSGSKIQIGGQMARVADVIELRALTFSSMVMGHFRPGPLAMGLALLGVVGMRTRRWAAPLCWIGLAVWLATGLWIKLPGDQPLPGAFHLFDHLPMLKRYWWPNRILYIASPAIALLIAGGAVRLPRASHVPLVAVILAALLLAEAFVVQRQLPLTTSSNQTTAVAKVLSEREGPVLLLPIPSGELRRNMASLLDQPVHGRPMVSSMMPPTEAMAPAPYQQLFQRPGLAHLVACEQDSDVALLVSQEEANSDLHDIGVAEVYVEEDFLVGQHDQALLDPSEVDAYFACIERMLGSDYELRGPLRIYPVSAG